MMGTGVGRRERGRFLERCRSGVRVEQGLKAGEDGRIFLEFDQRSEFLENLRGVQVALLADKDAFDVNPVLVAIR
jgi:hypothetical protein